MSIRLSTQQRGDVTLVAVNGKLTLGDNTNAFREKVKELARGSSRCILLDLAGVSYMDSSGLGELVGAHATVAQAGGELKLLNLTKRGHDLLHLTKLFTVFETFEDEAAALNSFGLAKAS